MKKELLKLSKALEDLNHSKESNDVKNIIKNSFFNEKDDSNYKEKIEEFNLDNINTFEEEESESEEDDKIKIAFFVRGNGLKHVGQKIVSKRLFDRGLKSILENFKGSLKLRFETPGMRYGDVKLDLFNRLVDHFGPYRTKREHFLNNPSDVSDILYMGAKKAQNSANEVLEKVRTATGISVK